MQADPIKPTLKAPGPKGLKLNCEVLLSTSAYKFNLRRYTVGDLPEDPGRPRAVPLALHTIRQGYRAEIAAGGS